MTIIDSIILGIVEGLTEFLPISSTAHLILTANFLGLEPNMSLKAFETIIQLGAIVAVVFIYKDRILFDVSSKKSYNTTMKLWLKLCLAFVPTGLVGLFFYSFIKELFNFQASLYFMAATGVAFLIIEWLHDEKAHHIKDINKTSYIKSVLIGCFQVISLLPGVSRSGATIMGGMLLGLKRKTAVEFSFLLAIPTMLVATVYELYKGYGVFKYDEMFLIGVGFFVSFVSSYVAVKWFLKFIEKYSFVPFGIYLIVSSLVLFFVL
ncbi:MAG: undecaprenyl-diphosphatase [Epsilonproteobacteria bacterium]|nr:MAG: undecaprenyl-diphosphatase [Campylobacteraceae bacterium 4484_166]RLA74195.1 MAG: undecaprenyl-diphosphatase [Campylobacterota bacterium]